MATLLEGGGGMKLAKILCLAAASLFVLAAINYEIATVYDTTIAEFPRSSGRTQIFEMFWGLFGFASVIAWLGFTFWSIVTTVENRKKK